MLASVVVFDRVSLVKEQFFYLIPAALAGKLNVGSLVAVPFGAQKKKAIVVALLPQETWHTLVKHSPEANKIKLRQIDDLVEEGSFVPNYLVQLAFWLADYYHCSLFKALRSIIPQETLSGQYKELSRRIISYHLNQQQLATALESLKRSPAQKLLLTWASTNLKTNYQAEKELLVAAGANKLVLNALLAKDYLSCQAEKIARQELLAPEDKKEIRLNQAQVEAKARIINSQAKKYLLFGVTGSGKTEVYLQVAKELTQQGGQVILLVPEIALTPQLISRCRRVLGDKIAVWHSHLAAAERQEVWQKVRAGEMQVVIGSRSAIFLPTPDLKAIFIDEEHEWSYKQDQSPRYHVRDVAEKISELTGARLVLGSATPALETFYRAQQGELELLRLPDRAGKALLPRVEIIDLAQAERTEGAYFFSKRLVNALRDRLKKGEQSILFLNRRGAASAMLCQDCGKTIFCQHCDVALTLHRYWYQGKQQEQLLCHYCGSKMAVPLKCANCSSLRLISVGIGTQKICEDLQQLFPQARIVRIDSDSLAAKANPRLLFEQFKRGEADIIVGTQVIAKGWDLPKVSLIGVILADIGLHLPDFRASERVFQLLTQVAGRAGRADIPGEVIIQTLSIGNMAVEKAAAQDFEAFYALELKQRQGHSYPPFAKLVKLTYVDPDYRKARLEADILAARLREQADSLDLEVLGPAPALIPRKAGKYHFQILLKGKEFAQILPFIGKEWRIDIDPLDVG